MNLSRECLMSNKHKFAFYLSADLVLLYADVKMKDLLSENHIGFRDGKKSTLFEDDLFYPQQFYLRLQNRLVLTEAANDPNRQFLRLKLIFSNCQRLRWDHCKCGIIRFDQKCRKF